MLKKRTEVFIFMNKKGKLNYSNEWEYDYKILHPKFFFFFFKEDNYELMKI